MRTVTRWLGLATTVFGLAALPALADPVRGGASANAKVHGPVNSSAKPTKSTTKSTAPKGNSAAAKTKSGATAASTAKKSGTTTMTTSGGTGSTTTTTTWTPSNSVAQKLSTKANLMKKVQAVLGTADLNGATSGFKNFGQFVAAINVSNNHNIAFADLKAAMTGLGMDGLPVVTTAATGSTAGTTAPATMSLGQAIQQLKPGPDAETVAQTALTQADQEINNSPTTSSTSTSSSTSTTTTASTSTTGAKAKPKSKS